MSLHEKTGKALERIKTSRNAPSASTESPVSLPQFDSNNKKDGRGAESYNSKSETG